MSGKDVTEPIVYENEDGDYWVRRDQAADPDAALAAVERAWPGAKFEFLGAETVPLSDREWGTPPFRSGRKRRAWHFVMLP